MSRRRSLVLHGACLAVASCLSTVAFGQRQMEALDRGVIAVAQPDGKVFVSWRLLGTESPTLGFDVFRSADGAAPTKLNPAPLTGPTQFVDPQPAAGKVTYTVRAAGGGDVAEGSFTTADGGAQPYLTIPLQTPQGYTPGDASAADLDGDGRYELILKFEGRGRDNGQSGETDPTQLHAYTLEGRHLWTINLGPNIRGGAHYTQFQVADFNGDGRAEVICKTADGTVDGRGTVIGDANARHANENGHIQRGPERLTVFDGRTGAAIDTIPYQPARGGPQYGGDATDEQMREVWGDGYGNRGERYLAATAWLDGEKPSAVMCRGYYTRSFIWAVDFDGQKLQPRWLFDSDNPEQTQRNQVTAPSDRPQREGRGGGRSSPYSGQGYHSMFVADVDEDGRDEIIYGAMTVDDDGRGLYTTGWGHGDAGHVGDLDPSNPGLEFFGIQERFDDAGAHMHDLRTGRPLWKKASVNAATSGGDRGEGPGRGMSADIDPRHPGSESWALGAGMAGLWDAKGNKISDTLPQIRLGATQETFGVAATAPAAAPRGRSASSCNFRVYWDGDLLDELLDKNQVLKWNWEQQTTTALLVAEGCDSNNGTKSTPTLSADLFGDWREEIVLRTTDNQSLRIYTTTIPTEYRRFTLMHDPAYRAAIAWQNTAYNQPPHVSVNMMDLQNGPPARPNITLVRPAANGQ